MTDYIERDVIQESEVEEPISEQQIMESFMALQVSFAQLECMCEYQTIIEYCGTEIPHPTLYQEGDFGDAVSAFFDNIADWLAGIVRGMMQSCNRKTLKKMIYAIEQDKRTEYKFPKDFVSASVFVEMDLALIDRLASVLNDIKDGELNKRPEAIRIKLEGLSGKMNKNGDWVTSQIFDSRWEASESFRLPKEKAEELKDKDALVEELKKLYDINVPVTGRKLLKRLKFDKKETKHDGKIDKDINRMIRKAANNIAFVYDDQFNRFIKKLEIFRKDNEIKTEGLPSAASNTKPFNEKIASRTFRDQTDPVSSVSPRIRNDKS